MLVYNSPNEIDDAIRLHAEGGVILAGGTTTYADIAARPYECESLVDIMGLGLGAIANVGGAMSLGAGVTLAQILQSTKPHHLQAAARSIGGPALRNVATVGGNIVYGGDLAASLLALNAEITTHDSDGAKAQPLNVYYSDGGPGAGLISELTYSVNSVKRLGAYKLSRRKYNAKSVVSAAVCETQSGEIRVGLVGASDTPMVIDGDPGILKGSPSAADIKEMFSDVIAKMDPPTDYHATGSYRRAMVPVAIARAVATL